MRLKPPILFLLGATIALFVWAFTAGGCRMQTLTADAIAHAHAKWTAASLSDYDLVIQLDSLKLAVTVRADHVTRIEGIDANLNVGRPDDYSIEGLFDVLELELQAHQNPADSSRPGTPHALMRVRFDPQYGYPEHYLRSSGGPTGTHEFKVLSFRPAAGSISLRGDAHPMPRRP